MTQISLEQARIAVEKSPDDLRLRGNLKYIEDHIANPGEKVA
jgi:hypothetical protein